MEDAINEIVVKFTNSNPVWKLENVAMKLYTSWEIARLILNYL
jgi:hypothetical protein